MLDPQAQDLWTADHEIALPLGVPFPTRMTVVRLADGSLALISPIPVDDALAAELAAIGPVSHLIAPNGLHDLHLAPAQKRYPQARLLGPPGLRAKKPAMTFEALTMDAPAFQGVMEGAAIEGAPRISETVLLHVRSRTLIVTDLVFNVEKPLSWKTSALLWSTGTRGKLAQSRVWRFWGENAPSIGASCRRVFEWDFDRLIVAHGAVIVTGAKARLAHALRAWFPNEPI